MHTEVKTYQVYFFGGPDGLWTNRSKIALRGSSSKVLAHINFNDPDMKFENDLESDGIIKMHLPSTMFENVIDVLCNEKTGVYTICARSWCLTNLVRAGRRGEKV